MKIVKISKTALFCVSLLGISIPCLANEIPVSLNNGPIFQQAEAVVIRVDQHKVILQDLGDKNNKIITESSNAHEFKPGDMVVLIGDTPKKVSYDARTGTSDHLL